MQDRLVVRGHFGGTRLGLGALAEVAEHLSIQQSLDELRRGISDIQEWNILLC